MASPAQLIEAVSRATGVPLPTLIDIDRKLVKAELRSKAGRGLHAALMTPIDAARLLTAVLTSPQANLSAEAVKRYGLARVDRTRSSERLFATAGLDDLAGLPAKHSFVDGLAGILKSAGSGTLAHSSASGTRPHIEIFAFTRATYGRIRVSGLPNGLTASVEYRPAPSRARLLGAGDERPATDEANTGDLEQSRRITGRTVFAVAQLLAKEGTYDG